MRMAGAFVLALVIGVSSAAAVDQGRKQPPARYSESNKTVWMSEWVACNHQRLASLARVIGVEIRSGTTPQALAVRIAKKAEAPIYDIYDGFAIAVDGCRNGILWRYYHGP
jgi:hypothetical protein